MTKTAVHVHVHVCVHVSFLAFQHDKNVTFLMEASTRNKEWRLEMLE